MDGVLVDSEREWERSGAAFVRNLYGADLLERMGDRLGLSHDAEFELARSFGFTMDREAYDAAYDTQAAAIYARAPLTAGIVETLETLDGLGYRIGLVSGSRPLWVETVLGRISNRHRFACSISLEARRGLRSKPEPDGYLLAMRELGADPARTIVVEDSNNGIRSGIAAGAFVVGYREHLTPNYVQIDAHGIAESMRDVVEIARLRVVG